MRRRAVLVALAACALVLLVSAALAADAPPSPAKPSRPLPLVIFPRTCLTAFDLAVVINDADPYSVAVGEYYIAKRRIPRENVVRVRFAAGRPVMSEEEFARVKAEVDRRTPSSIQAFALAWTQPFRVGCMSVTTAFAAGFDRAFCADGCTPTKALPYFDSPSREPWLDFGLRPAMLLAGSSVEEGKKLVDRGLAADGTAPAGTGYLVSTSNEARNVRAVEYPALAKAMAWTIRLEQVRADAVENRQDVLFYFTGLIRVDKIETNRFLPGAMADHLTSTGGVLVGSDQMSVLRWLEAGATGSYGAVVEPCNFRTKFPSPSVAVSRYTRGESLIEAYWKSVAMPGQGVFVGEPLANPFGGHRAEYDGDDLVIHADGLPPGQYVVLAAPSWAGPYRAVARDMVLQPRLDTLRVPAARDEVYRVVLASPQPGRPGPLSPRPAGRTAIR